MIKWSIFFLLLAIFNFTPVNAQVVNGNFSDGLTGWTSSGNGSTLWYPTQGEDGTATALLNLQFTKDVAEDQTRIMNQAVDVTGYRKLKFQARSALSNVPGHNGGLAKCTIGSASTSWYSVWWEWYEIDIVGSGVQTIEFENYHWDDEIVNFNQGVEVWVDNVQLTDNYLFNLSGYVTDEDGDPMRAYLHLNDSGDTIESNDTTGYYEFTEIENATYLITVTSGSYQDYENEVIVSGYTEHNVSMVMSSPVLTYTDSDTTVTDVFLFWKRNNVVDNVRIYKDTETRLLTTVGSGGYLSGMYNDRNLECNKGYVYWLQPMDGSVAGPKYRIDAKTDPCTDGGSGGTVPDPTSDPTPVVTPGPTVPPEINMTREEWLNLTLVEKQDVLTNITLMAPVDRLFSPLLEFKWEDVLVWGIHLFLILCAVLALDSITTQKISEYTGLIAIIPGGMFAYLGGYLVI